MQKTKQGQAAFAQIRTLQRTCSALGEEVKRLQAVIEHMEIDIAFLKENHAQLRDRFEQLLGMLNSN